MPASSSKWTQHNNNLILFVKCYREENDCGIKRNVLWIGYTTFVDNDGLIYTVIRLKLMLDNNVVYTYNIIHK